MNSILFVGVLGLLACGGSKHQQDAVNNATAASCDSYNRCGDIGSGKKYLNRLDCEIDNRAFWNSQWPMAECDNKINKDSLQFCLNAIAGTSCNNFLDALNTSYIKCSKADVCGG